MDMYPVEVRIYVVENVVRWTEANRFPVNRNRIACCGRDGAGSFLLVFQGGSLTTRVVAHEIAHCTFRIMEYIGCPHSDDSDEPYASLHEHITAWVYQQCKKRLSTTTKILLRPFRAG